MAHYRAMLKPVGCKKINLSFSKLLEILFSKAGAFFPQPTSDNVPVSLQSCPTNYLVDLIVVFLIASRNVGNEMVHG